MPRRRRGERVLGPYPHRRGWRIRIVGADGQRRSRTFSTRERAEIYKRSYESDITQASTTIGDALEAYEKHLNEKGNKPTSITLTLHRVNRFFTRPAQELDLLGRADCTQLYTALKGTGVRVDTHRNTLIEARTFLRWCQKKGWLRKNPLDDVEGTGRRTYGKEQLRIDEARTWEKEALRIARAGELGAVAALMALKMGMRASEIVSRSVRDLDDDGHLLWIPDAKTRAGRRTVLVHPQLRPFLVAAAKGRRSEEPLFAAVVREGEELGRHWRDWPREWVQRICTIAGVKEVTAHGMRGLFATLDSISAVMSGAGLEQTAKRMGHTSYRVTERSYADRELVAKAKAERAWEVLDGGIGPRKAKRSR